MEITFRTRKLWKQCNDSRAAVREFGPNQARKLRQRLDDLQAAENLGLFRALPGRCHELKGDRKGQLSLDLEHPFRLVFEPAHDPPPMQPDGGLGWKTVTAVRILEIVDTHD